MENNIERNNRKVREGIVVSDKMDKTVVVLVAENKKHPVIGKIVRTSRKFKVHDETNDCKVGDKVEIAETRHLSKDKYFRVVRIIERAK